MRVKSCIVTLTVRNYVMQTFGNPRNNHTIENKTHDNPSTHAHLHLAIQRNSGCQWPPKIPTPSCSIPAEARWHWNICGLPKSFDFDTNLEIRQYCAPSYGFSPQIERSPRGRIMFKFEPVSCFCFAGLMLACLDCLFFRFFLYDKWQSALNFLLQFLEFWRIFASSQHNVDDSFCLPSLLCSSFRRSLWQLVRDVPPYRQTRNLPRLDAPAKESQAQSWVRFDGQTVGQTDSYMGAPRGMQNIVV